MNLTYRGIKYNNQRDTRQVTSKVEGQYRGKKTTVLVSEVDYMHINSLG